MYAIGGSENPTILSEGNRFTALNDNATKDNTSTTKKIDIFKKKTVCEAEIYHQSTFPFFSILYDTSSQQEF